MLEAEASRFCRLRGDECSQHCLFVLRKVLLTSISGGSSWTAMCAGPSCRSRQVHNFCSKDQVESPTVLEGGHKPGLL
jgi:hypothetical protein